MIIAIGSTIKDGPWGGGNLFAINFIQYFKKKGYEVTTALDKENIDIIVLTDPRKNSSSSSFNHKDIMKYLKKNPRTKVIHRINECDERKGTSGVNKFISKANKIADSTVFVSEWLMELYINQGYEINNPNVILSGSNKDIFSPNQDKRIDIRNKIKLVTHHWGYDWNKGFDIYDYIDKEILPSYKYIEFTYVGNIPKNYIFENTVLKSPLSGHELSSELSSHDIYLTASLNEPSGNHHIEGALCGLPVLYLDSGGIPEYTKNFGICYTKETLLESINLISDNYMEYQKKLKDYPYESNRMLLEYEKLFLSII